MNEMKKFDRALRRYTKASVALSWKGSQPPEDHPGIEQEHQAATLALRELAKTYVEAYERQVRLVVGD